MKRIGVLLIIWLLIASSAGFGQDYRHAGQVLDRWTLIMEHFVGTMESEADLGRLGEECLQLADSIEIMVPHLKDLMNNYPDLFGENPPEEVMPSIQKNQASSEKFGKLMGILTKKANENAENEAFQGAFARLNKAIYMMYQ